eukprot:TRINITY_DN109_c0_g1_i1.p1 TRINITY_DN109_c0_g1~~TRINITY_DN109_c0_g1_i1.p1  ORF type:complete len:1172 (-),score=318.91 TRINITY_DN109_c0_g1_i1:8-3523(-)
MMNENVTYLLSTQIQKHLDSTNISDTQISLVNKDIDTIDVLDDVKFHQLKSNVEVFYISNNYIKSFSNIEQFSKLRIISAANCCIQKFGDIIALKKLPQLSVLNLQFNPITSLPFYRAVIISMFPSLTMLDSIKITLKEREAVEVLLQQRDLYIKWISNNYFHLEQLNLIIRQLKLHYELFYQYFEKRCFSNQEIFCKFSHVLSSSFYRFDYLLNILPGPDILTPKDTVDEFLLLQVRKKYFDTKQKTSRSPKKDNNQWLSCYKDILAEQSVQINKSLISLVNAREQVQELVMNAFPQLRSTYVKVDSSQYLINLLPNQTSMFLSSSVTPGSINTSPNQNMNFQDKQKILSPDHYVVTPQHHSESEIKKKNGVFSKNDSINDHTPDTISESVNEKPVTPTQENTAQFFHDSNITSQNVFDIEKDESINFTSKEDLSENHHNENVAHETQTSLSCKNSNIPDADQSSSLLTFSQSHISSSNLVKDVVNSKAKVLTKELTDKSTKNKAIDSHQLKRAIIEDFEHFSGRNYTQKQMDIQTKRSSHLLEQLKKHRTDIIQANEKVDMLERMNDQLRFSLSEARRQMNTAVEEVQEVSESKTVKIHELNARVAELESIIDKLFDQQNEMENFYKEKAVMKEYIAKQNIALHLLDTQSIDPSSKYALLGIEHLDLQLEQSNIEFAKLQLLKTCFQGFKNVIFEKKRINKIVDAFEARKIQRHCFSKWFNLYKTRYISPEQIGSLCNLADEYYRQNVEREVLNGFVRYLKSNRYERRLNKRADLSFKSVIFEKWENARFNSQRNDFLFSKAEYFYKIRILSKVFGIMKRNYGKQQSIELYERKAKNFERTYLLLKSFRAFKSETSSSRQKNNSEVLLMWHRYILSDKLAKKQKKHAIMMQQKNEKRLFVNVFTAWKNITHRSSYIETICNALAKRHRLLILGRFFSNWKHSLLIRFGEALLVYRTNEQLMTNKYIDERNKRVSLEEELTKSNISLAKQENDIHMMEIMNSTDKDILNEINEQKMTLNDKLSEAQNQINQKQAEVNGWQQKWAEKAADTSFEHSSIGNFESPTQKKFKLTNKLLNTDSTPFMDYMHVHIDNDMEKPHINHEIPNEKMQESEKNKKRSNSIEKQLEDQFLKISSLLSNPPKKLHVYNSKSPVNGLNVNVKTDSTLSLDEL